MKPYDHKKIEPKWQKEWAKKKIYKTSDAEKTGERASDTIKPKSYVLDMFPYPSGEGLHVGHPKGYISTDIYSRFKKMNGYNVLHPMGWDAFGLPAENYAIKNKVHPRAAVEKNIKRYKEQLSIIGFNYDWEREINTTDPAYYKWTQWIFLKLLEKGLAFQSFEPINWCPSCQTGLANEDLDDGKCERCGSVVEKKPMRQWVLKITDYAERLLADLPALNWPESIKESQRNWIGKSEGAEIDFPVSGTASGKSAEKITVFTTRPDTLFGVTYLVISPEHPFIQKNRAAISNFAEVADYIKKTKDKTEIERTAEGKEKTGVELKGLRVINPANREELPIWVADFVLASYGTGAVMAVPAHDERDFVFAKKFGLPARDVIEPMFMKIGGSDEPRKNLPFKKRDAAVAIIKHWSEDKYLCLKWKKTDWRGFVIGGIESGETPAQAAEREIKEETGYQSPKFIRELGGTVHAQFYHAVKNENRWAHFHPVYFELQNGDRVEIAEEENAIHEIQWIPKSELDAYLAWVTDMRLIWDRVLRPEVFRGAGHVHTSDRVLEKGILVNSGQFSGQDAEETKKAIVEFVGGRMVTRYKLRDWVFSRQRYWGEPIPVIHCEKDGVVPVPEKDLPVKLPEVKNYAPTGTGESPLADIAKWVNVKCPKCGGKAKRETNTMPQWAGSCWYYLRYMDPENKTELVDPKKEKYWAPVDVYVGGAEHATRHLIYARFWHKFLFDLGVVSTAEPFTRLHNVGLILAEDGRKMSKRFGNVINPDEIVNTYGADTFRVHEMFMGPFSQSSAWDTKSIIGSRRFIERIWRLAEKVSDAKVAAEAVTLEAHAAFEAAIHATIAKVSADIESFSFNTAISGLMILTREYENQTAINPADFSILLRLVAPFAPHVADELWAALGNKKSIHLSDWPQADLTKITKNTAVFVVQVNGKVRGQFEVGMGASEEEVKEKALALESVKKILNGVEIRRIIFVKNRLINFVTG